MAHVGALDGGGRGGSEAKYGGPKRNAKSPFLVETEVSLMVFDDEGTLLIEHRWPAPGTKYVSSGRRRGTEGPRREMS
jgi:hypothetical protein